LQELPPLDALDAFHHHNGTARLIQREPVHEHDTRVLKLSGDDAFMDQRVAHMLGGVRLASLDGDFTLQGSFAGQQHAAHAAFDKQTDEL